MCTGPSDPSATHEWTQILQASKLYIYKYIFYIYILKINGERPTQGSYFSRANPLGTVFLSCPFCCYCGVAKRSQLRPEPAESPVEVSGHPGVCAGSAPGAEPGPNTLLCFSSSAFPFPLRWLRFPVQEHESDRLLGFYFSKYWKPGVGNFKLQVTGACRYFS